MTILFSALLLFSCASEKPQDNEPSAEKMSLKVDADDEDKVRASQEEEITEEETVLSEDNNENITNTETSTDAVRAARTDVSYDDIDVRVEASNDGWADMFFEEETFYFGTIEEGDVVKHSFKFNNIGTGDLVISEATATCGCTRPDYPFLPIGPKESGEINVSFHSTGKLGMQRKAVTIFSNSSPKVKLVYLEGKVVKKGELEVAPAPELQADTTSNN